MDDKEKSLFDRVADGFKDTIEIATEAAKKALEPEPLKPDEEVVVIPAPEAADFMSPMSPMPPMIAVVKKKPRKKSAVNTSGRITPVYDIPIPDTPLPTPEKSPKKASRRPAKKATKKAVKKSKAKKAVKKFAAKKSAKKTAKKTVKKSKTKSATKKKTAKKKRAKRG